MLVIVIVIKEDEEQGCRGNWPSESFAR
jgi:hypothetical protein